MRKSKGSVLAITVGFSLVFTMLGLASIYMSTLQSETQEKQILSQQAFWLAEAGLNRALTASSLPAIGISVPFPPCDGEDLCSDGRSYSGFVVGIDDDAAGNRQGDITSTGLNNNFQRTVWAHVVMTLVGIDTILKSPGYLDEFGSTDIVGKVETSAVVDDALFFDIFNKYKSEIKANYDDTGRDLKSNPLGIDSDGDGVIEGEVCWITEELLHLTGNSDSGGPGSILVIDGSLRLDGTMNFKGIIWITGNLEGEGNINVNGSLFVEGNISLSGGNSHLYYDDDAILTAVNLLNPGYAPGYKLSVLSWKELVD